MLVEWLVGMGARAFVLVAVLVICHPSEDERRELRQQKIAYKNRARNSREMQQRNVTLISLLAALFFVDFDK